VLDPQQVAEIGSHEYPKGLKVGVPFAVGLLGPVMVGMAGAVVSMKKLWPALQAPKTPALMPARTQKVYCPRPRMQSA
jgi:hypothetical protein